MFLIFHGSPPSEDIGVCLCVWCTLCFCVYRFVSLCPVSGLLKGQCERPTVCQSAGCWGCAGLAGAGGVLGRGRCHLGDGEWSATAGRGSDPPVAAPQPACLRCQSGLKRTVDARVSGWQTVIYTLTKCHCSADFVIKQCPCLTCRNQHHCHKKGHFIRLQAQGTQLLAEFKHCIQQRAHAQGPQGRQGISLSIQEGHRMLFSIKQSAEPHHQNLNRKPRRRKEGETKKQIITQAIYLNASRENRVLCLWWAE